MNVVSPKWAPHVVCEYTDRTLGDNGLPEPQKFTCVCNFPGCNATWKGECMTGMIHTHVHRFAYAHYHKDPLNKGK
jgi:hypothetical protein